MIFDVVVISTYCVEAEDATDALVMVEDGDCVEQSLDISITLREEVQK